MGEQVLVTGATGFIGSHLVDELIWKGYEVTALIRAGSDLRWLRGKRVKFIYGDLLQDDGIPSLKGFSYVFHLAGATRAIGTKAFFQTNQVATGRLMTATRNAKEIKRFVYLSTLAAAGPSTAELARREEDPSGPISTYGKSKLKGEEEVLNYRDEIPVTVLRPCAVYGPRDGYMYEYFRVISKGYMPFIGKEPVFLSLCYVDDLVSSLILAITRDHPSGEIFFVSDGEKYSLDFFADVISSALHARVRKLRVPIWTARIYALGAEGCAMLTRRPPFFHRSKCAEVVQRNWVCDITKAKKNLGFRPRFRLEAGVKVTLQWYTAKGWL